MIKVFGRILLGLFIFTSATVWAQDDIEQYLLSDSLEIEGLLDRPPEQNDDQDLTAEAFTQFGLAGRQFSGLADLSSAIEAEGYGAISKVTPAWIFGTRIDVGDHMTLGLNYQGNYFLSGYSEGTTESSRYTYFTFLIDGGYRTQVAGLQVVPSLGLGISQNTLTLKPNGTKKISWTELHANNDLISTIGQLDLALSLGVSVGKYFISKEGRERLLNVSTGMIFHPFSFNSPGLTGGEFNTVQISGMPEMHSTGLYLNISWGLSPKKY